jgi:hypothetical protein
MKRAEFIKLWCDTVAAGRKKNYPNIRPSEAAVERLHDMRTATTWWRKHRAKWAAMTRDQVLEAITGKEAPGPVS